MHHAVREDRLWFQNNPDAIVRFRSAAPGEFTPLQAVGEQPPLFRPSLCRASAPLRWVAVVDLMRLPARQISTAPSPPFDCECAFLPFTAPSANAKPGRNCSMPLPPNCWSLDCVSRHGGLTAIDRVDQRR